MSQSNYRFLFYVTLSYSYPILRPIEAELKKRGCEVVWFVRQGSEAEQFTHSLEHSINTIEAAKDFDADALIAPGNNIPSFFPGIKVQVFHGFNSGKKNTLKVRGYFDLYCSECSSSTAELNAQRQKNVTFDVVETGWPKLDPLFTLHPHTERYKDSDRKVILYAPTFSPSLTSTYALHEEIKSLSQNENWLWLVKFHPKVSKEEFQLYQSLESDTLKIVETSEIIPLLQAADVLLSDTSSIISEFAFQTKPAVSFRNRAPDQWLINFEESSDLKKSIERALGASPEHLELMQQHFKQIHPFQDGQSSKRVADAAIEMINSGISHLEKKPKNYFRDFKVYRELKKAQRKIN